MLRVKNFDAEPFQMYILQSAINISGERRKSYVLSCFLCKPQVLSTVDMEFSMYVEIFLVVVLEICDDGISKVAMKSFQSDVTCYLLLGKV